MDIRPVPQAQRRYEAVVDRILGLVEANGWQAGQALPPERELAELFVVSRNVLRQAFGVLEERGLLRTVRGSGRYLRDTPDADARPLTRAAAEIASLADLFEARTVIEVEVAGLACERRTSEQSVRLSALADRLVTWEDNLAFHRAIGEATHNFVLERLVHAQAELAGDLHQREHYEDSSELDRMRTEHQQIATAVAARDAALARQLMRDHLHRARTAVLASRDRT